MLHKIVNPIRNFIRRIRPSHNNNRRAYKLSSMLDKLKLPIRTDKKAELIERAVKNTVFYAAVDNTSIFQAAPIAAKIDGDTVMYHLAKLTLEDVAQLEHYIENIISDLIRKRRIPRRLSLAVDSTDYPFYGRYHGPYVIHTKDGYVYRYIMISVVAHKVAIPILVLPVSQIDSIDDLLERLLEAVHKLKIKIVAMYMDRGFYAISVVRILKRYGIRFVIGAPKTHGIKKVLEGIPRDGRIYTTSYVMKSLGEEEEVTLFMRWDRRKREWFIVVGSGVGIKEVKRYSRRWGIETEFRLIKESRIRTTTVNHVIRYFFVVISVLIYLLYAVVRLGEVPEVISEIGEFTGGVVTLYAFRRIIRFKLEVTRDDPP